MPAIRPVLFALFVLLAHNAVAAEPAVSIRAPADGAKLDVMEQHAIAYTVVPGSRGDHVHLYVDDKEVAILRQLEGQRTLPSLSPGPHRVCIKVVNKAHTPIGVEQCIRVTVE